MTTVVDFYAPLLEQGLLTPAERQRLAASAKGLPWPHNGGFEFRLDGANDRVDFHVNLLSASQHSAKWLAAFAKTRHAKDWNQSERGRRLVEFLESCSKAAVDTQAVEDVWLEFDPARDGDNLPSLFVGFAQYWGARKRTADAARIWLDRFHSVDTTMLTELDRCFCAVPQGAFVSHIGLMLSRDTPAIRINVKRLFPDRMPAFLRAIGWPGDGLMLADLLLKLSHLESPRLTLCVDLVSGAVAPGVALEISFVSQPQVSAGWAQLLDVIAASFKADAGKIQRLLAWPGWTTPSNADPSWPFDLIKEGLLLDAGRLIAVERRLSHIKIAVSSDNSVEAKAYASFGTSWISARADEPGDARLPYESWASKSERKSTAERSRAFFEQTTDVTVDFLGATFQGWLIDAQGDMTSSNRTLAARAGIRDGMRVLDAGCGACGPAIDIASHWNVQLDAVTNIPRQIEIANELVAEAGLQSKIRLVLGDYHALPMPDESYDLVLFLESSTSTDDFGRMFGEAWRVLKPGGKIYIKNIFSPPTDSLTAEEKAEMFEANLSQATVCPTIADVVDSLRLCNFQNIVATNMSARASGERWREALRATGANSEWSALGRSFLTNSSRSHWFCADIRAAKP